MNIVAENIWEIVCRDKHGNIKWSEKIFNLVPTEGLNYYLSAVLVGLDLDPNVISVALADSSGFGAFAAADSYAEIDGDNDWVEFTDYDETPRPAWTPNGAGPAAGSLSNSDAPAVFTVVNDLVGTSHVEGAVLISGTAAIIGEAAFTAPHPVVAEDILTVVVTATLASA